MVLNTSLYCADSVKITYLNFVNGRLRINTAPKVNLNLKAIDDQAGRSKLQEST